MCCTYFRKYIYPRGQIKVHVDYNVDIGAVQHVSFYIELHTPLSISYTTVLQAESVHLEIGQIEYVFPEAGEAEGLNLTNSSAAGITIPRALLEDRASGEEQNSTQIWILQTPQ